MNDFQLRELKGRNGAKKIILNHLKKYQWVRDTTDEYATYDQVWKDTTTNEKIIVEIKYREVPKDKYDTVLLEESKQKSLKALSKKHCVRVYYVNVYSDGARIFDITNVEGEDRTTIPCPLTTSGNNKIVNKKVILLRNTEVYNLTINQ